MELFIDMRRMVYPMVRLSITIIPVGMQIKWRSKEVYDSQGNAFDGTEVYHEGQGWTLAKLTNLLLLQTGTKKQ